MTPLPKRIAITAALAGLSLAAAACGASSPSATGGGTPVKGGTLTLLGKGDVDHLDTASAYYTVSYTLERAFTRQLVTYPASNDFKQATTVVADMATQVPTKSNGGISADGKIYTFHIKQGVKWDTTPARQVTAQDVLLGFKRLCNPASPVGAPGYYETTIVGFKDYCEPMLSIPANTTAIKSYIDNHQIAGIQTNGTDTVIFTLIQPASDFPNILALPFASAAVRREHLARPLTLPPERAWRVRAVRLAPERGPYVLLLGLVKADDIADLDPVWLQRHCPIKRLLSRVADRGLKDPVASEQLDLPTFPMGDAHEDGHSPSRLAAATAPSRSARREVHRVGM